MVQYRKAGRWVLVAALATAPGCKSGIPIWNPFAKQSSSSILQGDAESGYMQSPSATMPDPAPPPPRAEEFGWTAPFKKFGDAVAKPFKKDTAGRKKPIEAEDDPVSLTSKVAPPGPSLYVSLAKLQEKAGKNESAIEEYDKALEADSKHLPALLGKARLYDRMGKYEQAAAAYQAAIKAHPESAAAHNDLGLCYARANKLTESAAELQRAVTLDGEKALYRNNLATVLVELGRSEEAYRVLVKAHGEAVAHYNVGFLLNKRGQKRQALEQFQLDNQADPNFAPARQWIETLGRDVGTQATLGRTAQTSPAAVSNQSKTSALAQQGDPSLETPIASPIVVPSTTEPKFSAISRPRVLDAESTAKPQPTPLPPVTVEEAPSVAPAAEEAGPKLLGNEQARRTVPSTVGERYSVGDRYSAAVATRPGDRQVPATIPNSAHPPLPEQVSTLPPAKSTSNAQSPATGSHIPSTAGARYPASRY